MCSLSEIIPLAGFTDTLDELAAQLDNNDSAERGWDGRPEKKEKGLNEDGVWRRKRGRGGVVAY